MDLDIARQAGVLAAKRDQVAELIQKIEAAISVGAPLFSVESSQQADGEGPRFELMPGQNPAPADSLAVQDIALKAHQKELEALDKEIAKLDGPATVVEQLPG
jgi:hypothetical protein